MDFDFFLQTYKINPRPNASSGIWLMLLLPLALIKSCWNLITLTPTYKLMAIFSLGILISTIFLLHKSNVFIKLTIQAIFVTLFIYIYTEKVFLSILTGLLCTIVYRRILLKIFQYFPQSFTLGEGIVVSQAATCFTYAILLSFIYPPKLLNNLQVATSIIQFGLLGIACVAYTETHFSNQKYFYLRATINLFVFTILPLHIILSASPILWILQQIFKDLSTLKLLFYWFLCTVLAVLAVITQISNGKKASTITRKTFHILAFVVYLPGLIFNFSILYLASGLVLGIFFALEILRIFEVKPLAKFLQDGFLVYKDEKDVGIIAMTPIYLLVGCSLPLWIHPSPSDVTNSGLFQLIPLISGLLTIGIGDTSASLIGSKWGKHKWTGSSKSIEGTLACILSQFLVILSLTFIGLIHINLIEIIKIVVGIVVTSIVEAKTDQVDNLVLPLIMYIIVV